MWYLNLSYLSDSVPNQKQTQVIDTKRVKLKNPNINRAKSRDSVERPLPVVLSSAPSTEDELLEIELSSSFKEISFTEEGLADVISSFENESKPKVKKKKNKIKQETTSIDEQAMKELHDLICNKSLEELELFLAESGIELNVARVDKSGNTLLHLAAFSKKIDLIEFLLQNGADPSVANNKQEVPYVKTDDKMVKDIFILFARRFPDKYNYKKVRVSRLLVN